MSSDSPVDALRKFHVEVDERAAAVAARHGARLKCRRGCADCCVDGQEVWDVEAARIREEHAELLATGVPHAEGGCAFLDGEGACRIYRSRPYRCRTQGLPLRWFDEGEDGQPVEYRDICPLNEEGEPLGGLRDEDCWTIGEAEGRLAELAEEHGDGDLRRTALRSLFDRS
jgi:Fe-S-cluster containining protein